MTIQEIHDQLVDRIHGETNRDHRKLANNTYGRIEGDRVIVKLHDTDILESTADTLTMSTGGWFTVTTKERLHRYTPGLSIWSKKGVWFVSTPSRWDYDNPDTYENYHCVDPGRTLSRFFDGMVLRDGPDGVYVVDAVLDDPDVDLRKAIDRYVKSYTDDRIAELVASAVSGGAIGDCLMCQMGNDTGFGGDHLLLHVAESYTMATLARNAIDKAGYKSDVYLGMFHPDHYRPGSGKFYGDTVRRAIRKMLKANLLNHGLHLPTAEELEYA